MIRALLLSRCQVGVNAGNGIRPIWHMEIEFVGKCTRLVVEHFGQITETKVAHESYLLTVTVSRLRGTRMPQAVSEAHVLEVDIVIQICK